MKSIPLNDKDYQLVSAALQAIEVNYAVGRHTVGAAVRGISGRVFTGIHLNSRAIDVCAEWVAIGTAMTNGETELETIVAVMKQSKADVPQVVSPCGTCRELIRTYGDEIDVIVMNQGEISKHKIGDLLPAAYIPPNRWQSAD